MSAPADRSRDDLVVGRRPTLELLRAERTIDQILIAAGSQMTGPIGEIRKRADLAGVPVRMAPKSEIEKVAGGLNHQGVVAITTRFRYTPLDQLLARDDALLVFLDGITDPHNLGSLLRSADGAGWHGIVVGSRRSVGVTATVRRVSAGAAEVVPVARVTNVGRALEQAKKAGLWAVGLDADAPEDIWSTDLLEPPLALVLGAEGKGLSPGVRGHCDAFVRISSQGRLGSLNVGVAGAVAMFEVVRRKAGSDTL